MAFLLLLRLPAVLNPHRRFRSPQIPLPPDSAKSTKTMPSPACFNNGCDFFDFILVVRLVLLFAGFLDFEFRVVQERVLMMLRNDGEFEDEQPSGEGGQEEGGVSTEELDAHPEQPGGALGHALDLFEAEVMQAALQLMSSSRLDECEEDLFLNSCY